MIEAISPIKQQTYYIYRSSNNKNDQTLITYKKAQLLDYNGATALKNQILFKGNLASQEKTKNDFPINPQTLDFVLSIPNEQNYDKHLKYAKTGSKFFELYLRYILHKKFPLKDEGELTGAISSYFKSSDKARIINDLAPSKSLPKVQSKPITRTLQANCFNALLGAIIYENDDGFKTAFKFLDEQVGENIFPKDFKINISAIDELEQEVRNKGLSWQDFYQETRYFNDQWHYRIHYKNIILSQAHGGKHNHELRELCAKEALEKLKSGEVDFKNANDDNLIYTNYKKPTPFRIKKLEEFCQKWGLEFSDINLLHKVFLYGEMQDCSALAHSDTYQILEFIGDSALGFCTHEILQENLPNTSREQISSKRHSFVKNKNLAILGRKMQLDDYTMNRNEKRSDKRNADMFEALIGAIFLDGGIDGINNVYKFLNDNFRNEIINIEAKQKG